MNFSNKQVFRTFSSGDSKNAWADIESLGWKKISPISADGVANVFIMLNAAAANGRKINGFIDDSDEIAHLYLR